MKDSLDTKNKTFFHFGGNNALTELAAVAYVEPFSDNVLSC